MTLSAMPSCSQLVRTFLQYTNIKESLAAGVSNLDQLNKTFLMLYGIEYTKIYQWRRREFHRHGPEIQNARSPGQL